MICTTYQVEVLVEYGKIQSLYSYLSNVALDCFIRVKIEFGSQIIVGLVMNVTPYVDNKIALKEIIEVIDKQPILCDELIALSNKMADAYICNLMRVIQTILPNALRPNSQHQAPILQAMVKYTGDTNLKGKKQQASLSYLKEHLLVKRDEFNKLFGGVLKGLVERNCCEVIYHEKIYQSIEMPTVADLPLSAQQQLIYDDLTAQQGFQVNLLYGITGSGKSEIYLHIAKYWLAKNKQVLILVPEIGLTPQMVHLFQSRLGDNVAIYHSKLSQQERYQQYLRVKKQEVGVVVGTRSAVFLPFVQLGCLIIDEEHDDSYKQEQMPKYHTRDIVIWRGEYHDCCVVLASATPSLDSYARALKGKYRLLTLPQRINGELPQVTLVDMTKESKKGYYILSSVLQKAISETLANDLQIILLLNRRGYTPIMKCQSCQQVVTCPNCDIALVFHKEDDMLKCHTCGLAQIPIKICPNCQSREFLQLGYGTQRLDEELKRLFPLANVLRMDRDTTTTKTGSSDILMKFGQRKADILIGTQMIAKGLDFPGVALVGILNGDSLLSRIDYHATETTFSLLMQAAGRAGRVVKNSQVIIQAYQVNHYALQRVIKHDYQGFFTQEMKYRKLANYPPYQYLILITICGRDKNKLVNCLESIKQNLIEQGLKVLGPSELTRKFNQYFLRLTIKGREIDNMRILVKNTLANYRSQTFIVDVNPLHTEV